MALSRSDIQQVRALQQKKFRAESGLFVAEGVKVVTELIASPIVVIAVYGTEDALDGLPKGNFTCTTVSQKEMEKMSNLSSPSSLLAIARIPNSMPPKWNQGLILALDGIRDPGNLGTIIRTAKWFGIEQILCSTDCVDTFNPKVVQGAMGALFHCTVISCDLKEVLCEAKASKFRIVTATLTGERLYDAEFTENSVLVIGSESHGVRQPVREICQLEVMIPNLEPVQRVESLNAGVATAVLLAEITRRLSK